MKKTAQESKKDAIHSTGRILARVLAEDLKRVAGRGEVSSFGTSTGTDWDGCPDISFKGGDGDAY